MTSHNLRAPKGMALADLDTMDPQCHSEAHPVCHQVEGVVEGSGDTDEAGRESITASIRYPLLSIWPNEGVVSVCTDLANGKGQFLSSPSENLCFDSKWKPHSQAGTESSRRSRTSILCLHFTECPGLNLILS